MDKGLWMQFLRRLDRASALIAGWFRICWRVPAGRGYAGGRDGFFGQPTDFVLPFTRQFFWGKWVWQNFPRDLWNEATLYLGLPVTLLAILGYHKRREGGHRLLYTLLLIGFITSIILAMGTNLTWNEQAVKVSASSWLGRIFNNADGLVLLPGYFFFKYVPFYSIMRAWMRMGVIALLFNCAAAGWGWPG